MSTPMAYFSSTLQRSEVPVLESIFLVNDGQWSVVHSSFEFISYKLFSF